MNKLNDLCCQNSACQDYGRQGLDNIRVSFRYGPKKQYRMLTCNTCKQRFSERKGTRLFYCKIPEAKAMAVFQHLREKRGLVETSRLVGVNINTVVRLADIANRRGSDGQETNV